MFKKRKVVTGIARLILGLSLVLSGCQTKNTTSTTEPMQTSTPSMVPIPGGTFLMGSPDTEEGRFSDEGPQHSVTVGGFSMGKYEVTQGEYQAVMGTNPSFFRGDYLPVEQVSWYDAIEYCNALSQREGLTPAYTIDKSRSDPNNMNKYNVLKWMVTWNRSANGYRLPTEAEWEYACRGGTTTAYYTGDSISTSQANYEDVWNGTRDVGTFAANPWGLYDMAGNVWEWCWDWYGDYTSGSQTDPEGSVTGSNRVLRGGSWSLNTQYLRSANRLNSYPAYWNIDVGFRLVRSSS